MSSKKEEKESISKALKDLIEKLKDPITESPSPIAPGSAPQPEIRNDIALQPNGCPMQNANNRKSRPVASGHVGKDAKKPRSDSFSKRKSTQKTDGKSMSRSLSVRMLLEIKRAKKTASSLLPATPWNAVGENNDDQSGPSNTHPNIEVYNADSSGENIEDLEMVDTVSKDPLSDSNLGQVEIANSAGQDMRESGILHATPEETFGEMNNGQSSRPIVEVYIVDSPGANLDEWTMVDTVLNDPFPTGSNQAQVVVVNPPGQNMALTQTTNEFDDYIRLNSLEEIKAPGNEFEIQPQASGNEYEIQPKASGNEYEIQPQASGMEYEIQPEASGIEYEIEQQASGNEDAIGDSGAAFFSGAFAPNNMPSPTSAKIPVKKFICEVCKAAFQHRYKLEAHIQIHTGKDLHLCECDECGIPYRDYRTMKRRHNQITKEPKEK